MILKEPFLRIKQDPQHTSEHTVHMGLRLFSGRRVIQNANPKGKETVQEAKWGGQDA